MLSFLRGPTPPSRTKCSHLSTMTMENGRSRVSFSNDPDLVSKKTSISFTLPPCEPGPSPPDNSFMIPPLHIHPNQQEFFLVTSGTGLFSLNHDKVAVPAGETIVIPRGEYHRFANASTTAPMTLEAWYDPEDRVREERFFRNLCGYLVDCTAAAAADGGSRGMIEGAASIPQLALFSWEADVMLCELMVAFRVPKAIGIPASIALTWFLGVFVGKWMLGYQASYDEYFHEKQ